MLHGLVEYVQKKAPGIDASEWLPKAGDESWLLLAIAYPNRAPEPLVDPLVKAGMNKRDAVFAAGAACNIRIAEHEAAHYDWDNYGSSMAFAGLYLGSLLGSDGVHKLRSEQAQAAAKKSRKPIKDAIQAALSYYCANAHRYATKEAAADDLVEKAPTLFGAEISRTSIRRRLQGLDCARINQPEQA